MLWKLLKQHTSVSQLVGFFLANLCGTIIVLLSIQFYRDIKPVFSDNDSFIKKDYIIVSKRVSTLGSLVGNSGTFSDGEQMDVKDQPFVKQVGAFCPAQFKVSAAVDMKGARMSTALFFESVPDGFVDVDSDKWNYKEGQREIPIVIPRNYLNLYNFGFAQSRNLPQLSEGMMGMIPMEIHLRGGGKYETMKGRIVGFSSRLNTILVPQSFMKWANVYFGGTENSHPSRLIVEVSNPADERIAKFFKERGYETEDDKLDAGKTTWFLKMIVGIVLAVGLLITFLSFYILMLSIYLLLQKNAVKLQNLLLIGYTPSRVARPYQVLTLALNGGVWVLSMVVVCLVRGGYMHFIENVYPTIEGADLWLTGLCGGVLFLLVSSINILAIRKKVDSTLG